MAHPEGEIAHEKNLNSMGYRHFIEVQKWHRCGENSVSTWTNAELKRIYFYIESLHCPSCYLEHSAHILMPFTLYSSPLFYFYFFVFLSRFLSIYLHGYREIYNNNKANCVITLANYLLFRISRFWLLAFSLAYSLFFQPQLSPD